MRYAELEFRRLAVWGGGREGRAALAALSRRFPDKSITWIVPEAERDEVSALAPDTVRVAIEGSEAARLAGFEVVVKSPGISVYRPEVSRAVASGVRFTSGSAIWFAEHPRARCICVTGTKGKSTTAAVIAHLLRAAGVRTALAGNIGLPLLALDDGDLAAWHVIELSSFQTADLDVAPEVAVLTSLVEEHLDWHGSTERYRRDKLKLFWRAANAVLPGRIELGFKTGGDVRRFALPTGWHVAGGWIKRQDRSVLPCADLPLPGVHNALNVCAALTALDAAGFAAGALLPQIRTFKALPHRLQELGELSGILYVNDSIATTPAAMLAALRCYRSQPMALILGGQDRGLDWAAAVEQLAEAPPRMILTQGEIGPLLTERLRAAGLAVTPTRDAASAVALARLAMPKGSVVLLSPGAPSFPLYKDYTERGRAFARAAGFDPDTICGIAGMGVH